MHSLPTINLPSITTQRYNDADLDEFLNVIHRKLTTACAEYADLVALLTDQGDGDGHAAKGMMEANAFQSEREDLARTAQRLQSFIGHLRAAEHRVRAKNYGVCAVSGRLIPKERLLLVPHTTQCVDVKEAATRTRT